MLFNIQFLTKILCARQRQTSTKLTLEQNILWWLRTSNITDYWSRLSLTAEWLGEDEGDSTERMLDVEVEGVKLERDWTIDWGEGE